MSDPSQFDRDPLPLPPHPRGEAPSTRALVRREFVRRAAAGSLITLLGGGTYYFADELVGQARAEARPDGKPRLPPGQRLLKQLKPMGGQPGDPSPGHFKLKVHGAVAAPFELSFADLLALPQVEQKLDVHCVTGWTVFDAAWQGVRLSELAKRAQLKKTARHVIFEAAHGYTANVPLDEALRPNVMIAHRLDGRPLPRAHGAPVRNVVPDLYFWKSAKWLTGIRFVTRDEPGYWERRGYNNHGDPWLEERYA
jgi:DMSO/TMAO reductase YedYZ molybdopterin-dependent catalytic subunit